MRCVLTPAVRYLPSLQESEGGSEQSQQLGSTSALFAQFPRAFKQDLGVYSTRKGEEVQAPVLMLQSRPLGATAAAKDEAGRGDSDTESLSTLRGSKDQKKGREKLGWCHFAYPTRIAHDGGRPINSYAEFVRLYREGKANDAGA